MGKRNHRVSRLWLYLPLFFLAAAAVLLLGLRYLGTWLVVDEPLRPADAIVVMGGGFPYRPATAAELFRSGIAKEVWLTQGSKNDRDRDLEAFGMPITAEHESGRWLLGKMGVPEAAIIVLPQPVNNTFTELQVVYTAARERHVRSLIIVTSKPHTRRVRVIWDRISTGDVRATLRAATREGYDSAHWWRTTTDALATFREAFGIVNVWAGLPVGPREH